MQSFLSSMISSNYKMCWMFDECYVIKIRFFKERLEIFSQYNKNAWLVCLMMLQAMHAGPSWHITVEQGPSFQGEITAKSKKFACSLVLQKHVMQLCRNTWQLVA